MITVPDICPACGPVGLPHQLSVASITFEVLFTIDELELSSKILL
jgi:hypothetical protein